MSRAQSSNIVNQATGNSRVDTGNAQTAIQSAMPSYQAELANPGYTDPQKTAITGATEGGLGAAFGSAAEGAANTAARTNNAAGLSGQQDALARQRMITSGNIGAKNQMDFANNSQEQAQQARSGLGQLYSTSLGGGNASLNTAQAASASNPSFWDQFGASAAKSLGNFSGSAGGSVGFG